jgi:serine/threonine protein kinase
MTTLALKEGDTFADRYRILRRIASGGMGDVFEAIHIETDRKCALKIMLPHMFTSERLRQRFRQEARIVANIDSEFIVTVFDAGIDEATDMPFLVMELLRGEELKQRLHRLGPFSPADVVTYLYQTALALAKTHKASIIHRDLKPDNLFLTEREDGSPRIKVLDFGIAKILAGDGTQSDTTHEMMGTPHYMAPEQFRVDPGISSAADIYSLGMIAYTLLVGAPYWKEEIAASSNVLVFFAAYAMHGPNEPATVRARRFGVPLPPAFDAWFSRATAVFPEDRYPSALTAVRALADSLGVPRPGEAPSPTARPAAAPLNQTVPMLPRPLQPSANPEPLRFTPRVVVPEPPRFTPRAANLAPPPASPRAAPRPYSRPNGVPPAPGYSALDNGSHTLSAGTTTPMDSPPQRRRLVEVAGTAAIAVVIGSTLFLLGLDSLRARAAAAARPTEVPADVRDPSTRTDVNLTHADLERSVPHVDVERASGEPPIPTLTPTLTSISPKPPTRSPAPALSRASAGGWPSKAIASQAAPLKSEPSKSPKTAASGATRSASGASAPSPAGTSLFGER